MTTNRFLIILTWITLSFTAMGSTIHWLTFIDTTDPNVGELDVRGRDVLYNHFIHTVNAALAVKGYQSKIYDYYGKEMSPYSCKKAVESLNCGSDDIVVFYYIGHGTRSRDDNNPYPQMLLGTLQEDLFIPLKWVHEQLKGKQARLAVTIGMCCNVAQPVVRAKNGPTFAINYGNVQLTDTEIQSIQQLFLGQRGDLIVSSASVGETSKGCHTPFGDMDLFTAMLCNMFEDKILEQSPLSWEALMDDVAFGVKLVAQENLNSPQTPFYHSNLTKSNMPTKQEQPKPAPPTNAEVNKTGRSSDVNNSQSSGSGQAVIDVDNVKNKLSACFDFVVDTSNSQSERNELAERLKGLFTPDAMVKFVNQDGNMVIDRELAHNFIGRLSTVGTIKVIPLSFKHDGQRITELKVTEIIRKSR